MKSENPYEYLKQDYLEDAEPEPILNQTATTITDASDETVTIYTSSLSDGNWVYGYAVYWANGRTSTQQPTATLGLFKSQREAMLYAIGFMLLYSDHFTVATTDALRRSERTISQAELF